MPPKAKLAKESKYANESELPAALTVDSTSNRLPDLRRLMNFISGEVQFVAHFLQSQARQNGLGQIRAFPSVNTHIHPTHYSGGVTQVQIAAKYHEQHFHDYAPLDCITLQLRTWAPTEKDIWDALPLESKLDKVDGLRRPPQESAMVFTVQVLWTSVKGKAVANLRPSVKSSAVLVINKNGGPFTLGWVDDFRQSLPTHTEVRARGNKSVAEWRKAYGSSLFQRMSKPVGQGAQILLDKEDMEAHYDQEHRDFLKAQQVDTWDALAKKLFGMANDRSHEDRLMTGGEFRRLLLFAGQSNDRVDHPLWHAIATAARPTEVIGLDVGFLSEDDEQGRVGYTGVVDKANMAKGTKTKAAKTQKKKPKARGGANTKAKKADKKKKKKKEEEEEETTAGDSEDDEAGMEEREETDVDDVVPSGAGRNRRRSLRNKGSKNIMSEVVHDHEGLVDDDDESDFNPGS